jgi:hypothetical protein
LQSALPTGKPSQSENLCEDIKSLPMVEKLTKIDNCDSFSIFILAGKKNFVFLRRLK